MGGTAKKRLSFALGVILLVAAVVGVSRFVGDVEGPEVSGVSEPGVSRPGPDPEPPSAADGVTPVRNEATSPAPPRDDDGPRLVVCVIDTMTRAPIRGGIVVVSLPSRDGSTAVTLEERSPGRHELPARGVMPHLEESLLTVTAPGYTAIRRSLRGESTRQAELAVELAALSSLVVRVVDEGQQVIPSALVRLTPPRGTAWTHVSRGGTPEAVPYEMVLEADDKGAVVFDDLVPGAGYLLAVPGQGLQVSAEIGDIELAPGEELDLTIVVPAGASIVGTILDCQGRPGGDFEVSCNSRVSVPGKEARRDLAGHTPGKTTRSRADGTFELEGLTPGGKRLSFHRATGDLWEGFALELDLAPGETRDCGQVGPSTDGTSVSVMVVDEAGVAVSGAIVAVRSASGSGGVRLDFETDSGGEFRLCGIHETELFVSARLRKGNRFASTRIAVERSRDHEIILRLPPPAPPRPGGHLELHVHMPDGTPADLRELVLNAYLVTATETPRSIETAQDGGQDTDGAWNVLRVSRTRPGTYDVHLIGAGHIARLPACVVSDGAVSSYSVTLQPASSLSGTVVDAATGEGVRASLRRVLAKGDGSGHSPEARTDEDGGFVVRLFAPGEPGILRVSARGFETKEMHVLGGDRSSVEIALEPE